MRSKRSKVIIGQVTALDFFICIEMWTAMKYGKEYLAGGRLEGPS